MQCKLFYCMKIAILSTAVAIMSGCDDELSFVNTPPGSIVINGDICDICGGDWVSLSGEAEDPDGDQISYEWAVSGGTLDPADGKGQSVLWTAPAEAGYYKVKLTVTDGIDRKSSYIYVQVMSLFPDIAEYETLTLDDPTVTYVIKGGMAEVPIHSELRIGAGIKIYVSGSSSGLDVEGGALIIEGESGAKVTIGPSECSAEGRWNGISLGNSSVAEITHMNLYSAKEGISLDDAELFISNSNIFDNTKYGINANYTSKAEITDCDIHDNGTGINVSNSNVSVTACILRNNLYAGIAVDQDSGAVEEHNVEITECSISGNEYDGIRVISAAEPVIRQCAIYMNGMPPAGYAIRLLYYKIETVIDAEYNYWGTTDEEEIAELIYDHNDNPILMGTVKFDNYLSSSPVMRGAVE